MLSLERTKLKPTDTAGLSVLKQDNCDQTSKYINELLMIQKERNHRKLFGFPPQETPETQTNIHQYKGVSYTHKKIAATGTAGPKARSTTETNSFQINSTGQTLF